MRVFGGLRLRTEAGSRRVSVMRKSPRDIRSVLGVRAGALLSLGKKLDSPINGHSSTDFRGSNYWSQPA